MSRGKWHEQNQEIFDRLDISSEYQLLGLKVSNSISNQKGWLACNSIDRPEQRTPSAGINVRSGKYRDHRKDSSQSLNLFEFAVQYGTFSNYREARKHYAEKAGVLLTKARKPKDPETSFEWQEWRDALAKLYLAKKPGISLDALKRSGARRAIYGKRNQVFAIPVWGKHYDDAPPAAWLAFERLCDMIDLYQGKDSSGAVLPFRQVKTACPKSDEDAVWAGSESLLLDGDGIELVIKTEGYSDMLSVMSQIPDDKIGKILVVTNPFGTDEIPNRWQIDSVIGKKVVIVHDCDKPGQGIRGDGDTSLYGAARWADSLATTASEVRNLVLPFPISEDHGKDIRDWFIAGGTWDQFMALIDASPIVISRRPVKIEEEETASSSTYYDTILDQLGITILGEDDDECIFAFCSFTMKRIHWPNVAGIKYESILQQCGSAALELVANPGDQDSDDGKIEMKEVRSAIAIKASKTRSQIENLKGKGLWPGVSENGMPNDTVVVVAACEAACFNGKMRRVAAPKVEGLILDFTSIDPPWYGSFEHLENLVERAKNDRQWARDRVSEMNAILSKWKWRSQDSPSIIGGLILTTWVQTFYSWRPYVAITGRSNSGKTSLFELLQNIFQDKALCVYTTNSTEAGLRQRIGSGSPPTLLDEFERNDRTTKILEALRASSRTGVSLRGSSNHKHQSFSYNVQPWMTAVNLGIEDEADKNRVILGEVLDPEGVSTLTNMPTPLESRKLGLELCAVAIANVFDALKQFERLSRLPPPTKEVSRRLVESYAVPTSMISAVFGFSDSAADEFQNTLMVDVDVDNYNESDEEAILSHILGAKFRYSHGDECTTSEAIMHQGQGAGLMEAAMNRNGICATKLNGKDYLFISNRGSKPLLMGTSWEKGGHIAILHRLEGSLTQPRIMCGNQYRRGVCIPWKHVEPHLGYDNSSDF